MGRIPCVLCEKFRESEEEIFFWGWGRRISWGCGKISWGRRWERRQEDGSEVLRWERGHTQGLESDRERSPRQQRASRDGREVLKMRDVVMESKYRSRRWGIDEGESEVMETTAGLWRRVQDCGVERKVMELRARLWRWVWGHGVESRVMEMRAKLWSWEQSCEDVSKIAEMIVKSWSWEWGCGDECEVMELGTRSWRWERCREDEREVIFNFNASRLTSTQGDWVWRRAANFNVGWLILTQVSRF